MGAALAGNDIILSEDGNDVLAGDALASGLGGTATADNIAAVVGSGDGDINFLAPLVPGLRSEEHTSELQSLMRISYAVFCLKKKKKRTTAAHNKSIQATKT